MRKLILLFFAFLVVWPASAQDEFQFKNGIDKVKIPFQLINNLIFIPIKVNGTQLTVLLDSGVQETILFSLEDKSEVSLKNTEKISLRGLGSEDAVEGLKSEGNLIEVNGMESKQHLLYIILDPSFNLSSHVGIPVNGIIGYSFLKHNLVSIDYTKKQLIVYKDTPKNRKKIEKKTVKSPISIEKAKPYINTTMVIDSVPIAAKLLIDIGNSDAIWLFQKISDKIKVPQKNFEDYLGKGFSGDVLGKRARISAFTIADFKFNKPIAAFPDSSSIKHVTMASGRLGSVGGEILKRFLIVFDYPNGYIYLRKNKGFSTPFSYNKSGIEISHAGMQWVKETVRLNTTKIFMNGKEDKEDTNTSEFKYKFDLKPVFEIANIRKKSPAEISGLQKGDIILSVNKNPAYKYTLQQINMLLRSEDEKWITLEIERNDKTYVFKFQLIDVL
ncbi:PDZ domain-containing protein [Flavobacterium granuli]|uniref:PDZ domain-containing protein n=1 Tax=Flavobacterium granuli TaxID=280093 RepID=A0A1M5IIL5_9FLAO|nr:PDZ domain-containing protein [Flavobacterium granuli]PRZ27965.1 PDZ domain-containing protein [Flavobacterium granuli]SHG27613.1 PDZ domain-containing protein [Flavobacterium granuli]